jgi:integrase/recombinase XerD
MLASLFPHTYHRFSSLSIVGGDLEPLCNWLDAHGFPRNAIRRRMRAAPFLDAFLRRQGIRSLRECTAASLRACLPREDRWTPQIAYALGQSLAHYLQERGELVRPARTPSEQVMAAYTDYLDQVRGLAPSTVQQHARESLDLLHALRYETRAQHLHDLQLSEIEAFITRGTPQVRRGTLCIRIGIVRSFLRFLAARGEAPSGLAAQIEAPRQYRHARLVRALSWEAVQALLQAVDQSTSKGRRDYAMLVLIATYGLRVSEVASLSLDDLDWRDRVIRVPRPKIGVPLAVPLTDEVGTALLAYLRDRSPAGTTRRVFLRVRAPRGAIQSTAVYEAFDVWARRAGLALPDRGGPHCLRHGVAMHLLRQGTPIKSIGDLLGHRRIESTSTYLRLHVDDLRDVALALPTSHAAVEAERRS